MLRLASLIDRYIQNGDFAGAGVIVAHHGQIVYAHYAGKAAPGLPADSNTLWPVASISKLYTAAAIMRLVELGEITLNTLVSRVIPQFTGDGREKVRLRHLLTHTSGLIYESPEMEQCLINQTPLIALIEEAVGAPLLFQPGESISYADYNYLLAGQMAAVATGVPFHELVQQLILEPMVLHNTFFPPPASEQPRIARVSAVMAEGTDGAMYNSPYALGLAHPAFGVVATAADLLRFLLHFAPDGPRVHAEITVQAMIRSQTGMARGQHVSLTGIPANQIIPWGYGFALQTEHIPALFSELASFRSFGHGGASGCQVLVDPEPNLVVCILTNTHLRSGREAWSARLQSIMNCALVNGP